MQWAMGVLFNGKRVFFLLESKLKKLSLRELSSPDPHMDFKPCL